ncbi:hypothetical protein PsorP6_011945 [Peronosclerospora sorghi]|uniref:Uncharacterized protein n=1 Tax=Peronosclerospora sorghi TaxID=230839 RepID=A0ACC0WJB8_9STRA|nr:hypothetical protein PsorP6_011945 [Peronosclerospora sorghi]
MMLQRRRLGGKVVCTSCGTDYFGRKKVRVCVECAAAARAASGSRGEDVHGMHKSTGSDMLRVYDDDASSATSIVGNRPTLRECSLETDDGTEVVARNDAVHEMEEIGNRRRASFRGKDEVRDEEHGPSARAHVLTKMYEEETTCRAQQLQCANKRRQLARTKRAHSFDSIVKAYETLERRASLDFVRNNAADRWTLDGQVPLSDLLVRTKQRTQSYEYQLDRREMVRLSHWAEEHCWHHEDATAQPMDAPSPRFTVSRDYEDGLESYEQLLVDWKHETRTRCHSLSMSVDSDPSTQRQVPKSSHRAGALGTRERHGSNDVGKREDDALRLAMGAMQVDAQEGGRSFHVTDETRRVASTKVMEASALEIARSPSNNVQTCRDTIAHPLTTREPCHEYRDLSDLTSSAFQAFQMISQRSRDTSALRGSGPAHSNGSDSSHHDFRHPRDQRKSMPSHDDRSSSTSMQLKSMTSDDRSDVARPVYDKMETRTVSKFILRANSIYGVADWDTFSDMDLLDFPHLMHKDAEGARNVFTDLQPSGAAGATEGLEYVSEPCFRDVLHFEGVQHVEDDDSESESSDASTLHDWHAKGPDRQMKRHGSESSFLDASSMTPRTRNGWKKYDSEAYRDVPNRWSETIVSPNDEQLMVRRYSQLPSFSELLSEDSEPLSS